MHWNMKHCGAAHLLAVAWVSLVCPAEVNAQAKKKAAPPLPPADFEPIAAKWEIALGRAAGAARFQEIAEEALLKVEPATAADQYAAAERLVQTALTAAKNAGHARLQEEARVRQKDVAKARSAFDSAQTAEAMLRRKPSDPDANLALGRYLCFTRRDWTAGFAKMALGSDEKLKSLAQRSVPALTDAELRAPVADAWWDEALSRDDGPERLECRLAAAYFYAHALPTVKKPLDERIRRRLLETNQAVELGRGLPGLIEIQLSQDVFLRMRLIPAGVGVVGSPTNERGRRPNEYQHSTTIARPFYLGITEVTQGQWSAIVRGRNQSKFFDDTSLPVESVSWNKSQQFTDRLNGLAIGKRYRFRLPTSAEWEYACRAGSPRTYFFGDDPTRLHEFSWHAGNSGERTHLVANARPNPWGLYDMLGNVQEWTSDLGTSVGGNAVDEKGEAAEELRIARGGDYTSNPLQCRSARLFLHNAGGVLDVVGFRIACDILPRDFAEHAPPPTKAKMKKAAVNDTR